MWHRLRLRYPALSNDSPIRAISSSRSPTCGPQCCYRDSLPARYPRQPSFVLACPIQPGLPCVDQHDIGANASPVGSQISVPRTTVISSSSPRTHRHRQLPRRVSARRPKTARLERDLSRCRPRQIRLSELRTSISGSEPRSIITAAIQPANGNLSNATALTLRKLSTSPLGGAARLPQPCRNRPAAQRQIVNIRSADEPSLVRAATPHSPSSSTSQNSSSCSGPAQIRFPPLSCGHSSLGQRMHSAGTTRACRARLVTLMPTLHRPAHFMRLLPSNSQQSQRRRAQPRKSSPAAPRLSSPPAPTAGGQPRRIRAGFRVPQRSSLNIDDSPSSTR